jgi:hypothetical protein
VSEEIEDKHFDYTNTSFKIIGVYANEDAAYRVYNQSIKYSIDEVVINNDQ